MQTSRVSSQPESLTESIGLESTITGLFIRGNVKQVARLQAQLTARQVLKGLLTLEASLMFSLEIN